MPLRSEMKMRITGVRPTGRMHIGHYFSVIKPALDLEADVLIAEYHAPQADRRGIVHVYETLEKFGVSMGNVQLQAETFDADLYFQLLSVARVGELERMTQYQSAGDDNDAHLLVYPVLMVHDVYGYDEVLVGDDQTQHVNYARDLIERFQKKFRPNDDYPVPLPVARNHGRVMCLGAPNKKMSKSEPQGCVFLDDTEEAIREKVQAAVMDLTGRANLISLYYDLGGSDPIPLMNSEFKPMVADKLIQVTAPMRHSVVS